MGIRANIKKFRLNIFKKLLHKVSRWARSTELELIDKMREESDKILGEVGKLAQEHNTQLIDLSKHFNDLHEDSQKEFMRNNKEISERYRKLNAAAEKMLDEATDLVRRLNNIFDETYIAVNQIRGMMHARTLVIENIQRSTALLTSDIKTLDDIETKLLEAETGKDRIVKTNIHKLGGSSV